MINQTQGTRKINTAEVILPRDKERMSDAILPSVLPKSPLDWPVDMFTQALDRREVNRKALLKWIESNLQHGVDYGQIHVVGKDKCEYAKSGRAQECPNKYHWSKPSLWKPGAEKICGMMGIVPRFPNIDEYEKAVIQGADIKVIILKCELHTPSGFIAAEGSGARRVDQDKDDINKSLKMAEKSAHINATLRIAGLSEIFTQDLEDMLKDKQDIPPGANNTKQSPRPNPPERDSGNSDRNSGGRQTDAQRRGNNHPDKDDDNNSGYEDSKRITSRQHKYILKLALERGISRKELNKHCLEAFGVSVDYLSRADASSLIDQMLNQ
jgi:AraC-like DNA-binding protein